MEMQTARMDVDSSCSDRHDAEDISDRGKLVVCPKLLALRGENRIVPFIAKAGRARQLCSRRLFHEFPTEPRQRGDRVPSCK
jgi:hypothetical protein